MPLGHDAPASCTSSATRYVVWLVSLAAPAHSPTLAVLQPVKRWKKRWFELAGNELSYSKTDGSKIRGSIALEAGCIAVLSDDDTPPPSKAQSGSLFKVRLRACALASLYSPSLWGDIDQGSLAQHSPIPCRWRRVDYGPERQLHPVGRDARRAAALARDARRLDRVLRQT